MKRYDPAVAPDAEAWLALDEGERLELVEDYHRQAGIRVPNAALHATAHTIVENQIAMGDDPPTRRTVERLMRQGLDRHDALHAVAGETLRHLQDLLQVPPSQAGGAAAARYAAALDGLTAEGWLASLDEDGDGFDEALPVVNPMRHVGRNDPCPCGSGKKYKKCCQQ